VIFDRPTIIDADRTPLAVQRVPEEFGGGSYPVRLFSSREFLSSTIDGRAFRLEAEFDSYCDPVRVDRRREALVQGVRISTNRLEISRLCAAGRASVRPSRM
jgi:hypothetical protein